MPLELKNVTKRVGAEVLYIHETNLVVEEGTFNILLGSTLAGNTILMQLMAGIQAPTSGSIQNRRQGCDSAFQCKSGTFRWSISNSSIIRISPFMRISPRRCESLAWKRRRSTNACAMQLICSGLHRCSTVDRWSFRAVSSREQPIARAIVKDSDLILLDEPLANLDYKLREEMRDELPKLFIGHKRIVVYATTEPTEALLLGGNTATLNEGQVTQFGQTSRISSAGPRTELWSAKVFSDPPLNTAQVEKRENSIILGESVKWPAGEKGQNLPDGLYTIGIRPHHITPAPPKKSSAAITGRVLVTELSGSESVIHFDMNGRRGFRSRMESIPSTLARSPCCTSMLIGHSSSTRPAN